LGVTLTTEMINGAIAAQNKYGVPASVTLGQIILESGGNYPGGLSGLAYNDNNLFGIKAGTGWKGQTATYKTTEYANGKPYQTSATFRKYASVADSIDDHGKLLASSLYTNKTKDAATLSEYVTKMGAVYATSPTYANNLMNIINSYDLTQYDNGKFPTGTVNNSVDSSGSGGETVKNPVNTVDNIGFLNGDDDEASWLDKLFSKVVNVGVMFLLVILAIVFLLKAFDIMPTKQNMISAIIPKEDKPNKESGKELEK